MIGSSSGRNASARILAGQRCATHFMKSYIFMCSWETYGECIARNLFGHAKNFAFDIKPDDLCYLYQYDLKKLNGVWKATSDCQWHEKDAWGGKFRFQVRVSPLFEPTRAVPYADVQSIIEHSGTLIYKLDDARSHNLFSLFSALTTK